MSSFLCWISDIRTLLRISQWEIRDMTWYSFGMHSTTTLSILAGITERWSETNPCRRFPSRSRLWGEIEEVHSSVISNGKIALPSLATRCQLKDNIINHSRT
jgi:hypothetical protein